MPWTKLGEPKNTWLPSFQISNVFVAMFVAVVVVVVAVAVAVAVAVVAVGGGGGGCGSGDCLVSQHGNKSCKC